MIDEIRILPPHPVIFVGDPEEDSPDVDGVSTVNVAPAVISVLTQAYVDGPTTVRVVDAGDSTELPSSLMFEGELELPLGRLVVSDSGTDVLLERAVTAKRVGLQVWVMKSPVQL